MFNKRIVTDVHISNNFTVQVFGETVNGVRVATMVGPFVKILSLRQAGPDTRIKVMVLVASNVFQIIHSETRVCPDCAGIDCLNEVTSMNSRLFPNSMFPEHHNKARRHRRYQNVVSIVTVDEDDGKDISDDSKDSSEEKPVPLTLTHSRFQNPTTAKPNNKVYEMATSQKVSSDSVLCIE